MFKKILLSLSLIGFLVFAGCGGGDKEEAKKLLQKILQVVGIPYNIVVNICQDGNDNGICESFELQAKITIQKSNNLDTILEKIALTKDGKYFLETHDITKPILLELQDKVNLKYNDGKVTIPFAGFKNQENNETKELSLLEAMVDAGYLQAEEANKIKALPNRAKFDEQLFTIFEENTNKLEENNISGNGAVLANIEELSDELKAKDINGTLTEDINGCENNSECIKETLSDLTITDSEAKEINQKETEKTKNLLAGKTFYVVGEDGEDKSIVIFKIVVNQDATLFTSTMLDGTSDGESPISIVGNKLTFTNDTDGSYSLISQENGYILADDKNADGSKDGTIGHRLYASQSDAQVYFDSLKGESTNKTLTELFSGKTLYKPDYHDGKRSITPFTFNNEMTKFTATDEEKNETYTFDISTTVKSFIFTSNNKERKYTMNSNSDEYVQMDYRSGGEERVKEVYRFYFNREKATIYMNTLN